MGFFYETVNERIAEWILKQEIFWVATAPLAKTGHVNVSPKGGPYFGLIDETTFWYQDLTGSGNETISHLRENGRITVCFIAFSGGPRIVRLWGTGKILERSTAQFDEFALQHDVEIIPAARSIIIVDIHQVGSSCGFQVPFMEFKSQRDTLVKHFEKKKKSYDDGKKEDSMELHWAYKNSWSIDGLPGMQTAMTVAERENVAPLKKMVGPWAHSPYGPKSFTLLRYLQFRIAWLKTAKFDLNQVLIVGIIALLVGLAIGLYVPSIVSTSQRAMHKLPL